MRLPFLVLLILLIAVAPAAVTGACQAVVGAAIEVIGALLAGDTPTAAGTAVGVLLGGVA